MSVEPVHYNEATSKSVASFSVALRKDQAEDVRCGPAQILFGMTQSLHNFGLDRVLVRRSQFSLLSGMVDSGDHANITFNTINDDIRDQSHG